MASCPDDEEKLLLVHHHQSPNPKKGGLRTIPFIIVNESFERLASVGLTPNMIFYLTDDYHMKLAIVSTILSLWSALSNGLSIFGAVLADSYLGRFTVIALGCFSSLVGMTMLWLTAMFPQLRPPACDQFNDGDTTSSTCNSPTAAQLAFLISCYALISIGAGCNRPCSTAFGLDQVNIKENPNRKRLMQGFINWYSVSTSLAAVFAITIIVYIQDQFGWQLGFGIPAILMVFSVLIFLLGSPLYIKVKATESLFTGLFQVLVVAFKNRNISLPPPSSHSGAYHCNYHRSHESKFLAPTDNLRCLNKACIIKDPERDLKPDGSASDPWSLCTVEQVESLKALIRVIPMWSTGIMLIVSMYQNSFSTFQAKSMDRHFISQNFEIPAGSYGVVTVVSLVIWLSFYDGVMIRLLARCTGDSRGLSTEARMAISLVLSCIAMVTSAIVEARRREKVFEQGLEDDPHAKVDMSALWLLPQYAMLGVAEAFSTTAQTEFFYIQLPKEMASVATSLYTLELGAASLVGSVLVNVVDGVTSRGGKISWLDSNINQGHIDYYYWIIACLGILNFVYFLICLRAYRPTTAKNQRTTSPDEIHEKEEEEEVEGEFLSY